MNIDIKKIKIVVTVPISHLEQVRNAMCNNGAGIIENYTFCSTTTKCIGTFIPNNSSSPFIGTPNKLEIVEEEKLEAVCDIENVNNVLNAIKNAHSYETPAIDIIPLLSENDFN